VIGKEELFDGDEPGVKLTLAWMRTSSGSPPDSVFYRALTRTATEKATSEIRSLFDQNKNPIQRYIQRGGGFT